MFKFIPDHVGGVGSKRKQGGKSCEPCKKRHKRCTHGESRSTENAQSHASASPTSHPGDQPDGSPLRPETVKKDADLVAPVPGPDVRQGKRVAEPLSRAKDAYVRFVGDLSPEASFLSSRRQGPEYKQALRHAEVGVWLGQRPGTGGSGPSRGENGSIDNLISRNPSPQSPGLTCLRDISSQLHQECLAILPPRYELSIITTLYFAKVDPIFPILRDERFELYDPTEAVALQQCICLVAALDPKVRKHLRLPQSERILSPIEFRARVSAAVKQTLDMGFIQDKFVLLQVCALMAFYADRANFSEVSSYYVSQAVHHAHTLGLHLGWPDDGIPAEKSRRIFWCIWLLDRLNAAANGRPILMHRQDMGMGMLETYTQLTPPFRLLIRITQFLDAVISRYRPNSATSPMESVEEGLTFENLVREAKAEDAESALLATLEVFYLAVVILRHRPKEPEGQNQPVPSSDLQFFAATSIISIASEDFKFAITFWPGIPYAVSLATSIAYKSLRNSSMAHRRKRSYALFHSSCDVLDELGRAFSSARAVAKLATDTVQEVERVAADRSKARRSFENENDPPQAPQNALAASQGGRSGDAGGPSTQPEKQAVPVHSEQQQAVEPMSMYGAPLDNTGFHTTSSTFFGDFVGDAGIFNDFDPSFDLDRIDQVFSANLDPTQLIPPHNWLAHVHGD